jgi:glycosyltransferase involved in cell wall biosynthesis
MEENKLQIRAEEGTACSLTDAKQVVDVAEHSLVDFEALANEGIDVSKNLSWITVELLRILNYNKKSGELRLVSIARIAPEKNTLFALECLKNYKYKGKIEFNLYGSIYQQRYWQLCKECIEKIPSNISVIYHGELNNTKVSGVLEENHFLFLPTKGENFGHSILESFLAGSPVIISDQTPWRNLEDLNTGWDLSLQHPEIFAERIQESIDMDANEYSKMSEKVVELANIQVNNTETKLAYIKLFA